MKGSVINLLTGVLAAIGFHALLYLATLVFPKVGEPVLRVDHSKRLSVQVLSEVSEQMALFDPRPMLLPTEWNAANAGDLEDLVDEELPIFEDYEYRFAREEGGFVTTYGNPWGGDFELRDVQLAFDFPQLDQIGSGSEKRGMARDSVVTVRLLDPGSGRLLHEETLLRENVEEFREKWPGWAPVTYFITVVDSFFMHGATVLDSSGHQDLDIALQQLAKNGLENRGIWKDGSYILEVGL